MGRDYILTGRREFRGLGNGAGFPVTSMENGVQFNFFGNGAIQTSWTAAGADIGWLAVDRNGNGTIDDGTELFSNVAPQPGSSSKANGFSALAVHDQPSMGGNGDGMISSKDAVFSRLLIWVDKKHDGISQPSELLTMQQANVKSISVNYRLSWQTDV